MTPHPSTATPSLRLLLVGLQFTQRAAWRLCPEHAQESASSDVFGVEVLGISTDSLSSHEEFDRKFNLAFPLPSDEGKIVANAYDAWGEKEVCGRTVIGMRRMAFLTNKEGKIQKV